MNKEELLTQDILKQVLEYTSATGLFTWKVVLGVRCVIGEVAGTFNQKRGYIHIKINGRCYTAHRLAFLYMEGKFPTEDVDHIDHIRHNNRWNNLRKVSRQDNMRNQSPAQVSPSGELGVAWNKQNNNWRVKIRVDSKDIEIGSFTDKQEAIAARKAANITYGFHKNHGVLNV